MALANVIKAATKLDCGKLLSMIFRLIHYPSNRKQVVSSADAESYMQSLSPDPDNGCVRKEPITYSPEYDLQIVVPVYNTEKYLKECLDSIFNQSTCYSYRVILVNDGSTDGSDETLRQYENLPNVEIIRQENKGLSGARNAAINTINAKYVTFVDSDDRLSGGAIERMMNAALETDADIVDGDVISYGCGLKNKTIPTQKGEKHISGISGYAWGKVIKSELFDRICFPEGYWFEDTLMLLVVFQMSYKIVGVTGPVYEYRSHSDSITSSSKGNPKSLDSFYITRRLLKDAASLGIYIADKEYVNALINRQMRVNFQRILSIGDMKLLYALFVLSKEMVEKAYSVIEVKNEKSKGIIDRFLSLSFRDFVVKYM